MIEGNVEIVVAKKESGMPNIQGKFTCTNVDTLSSPAEVEGKVFQNGELQSTSVEDVTKTNPAVYIGGHDTNKDNATASIKAFEKSSGELIDEKKVVMGQTDEEPEPTGPKQAEVTITLKKLKEGEAKIVVHIQNESGDSLNDVSVSISGEVDREKIVDGSATFEGVPVGLYHISANKNGYEKVTKQVTESSFEVQ